MKILYLIRHGKPDFPEGKRMCLGWTDLPLSEEGLFQAQQAAKLLAGKKITVFSSPLIRARQTAEALGRPVILLEELMELHAGAWDGLSFEEIKVKFPELYAKRAEDKTIPLPGAESNEAGLMRFETGVRKALNASPGDLAIVGHGGIMALFLESCFGKWEKPGYGQIVPIGYQNGKYQKLEGNPYA